MVQEGGIWEQILGSFLLLDPLWNLGFSKGFPLWDSQIPEGFWIPFGILESLRSVGSPLGFLNPETFGIPKSIRLLDPLWDSQIPVGFWISGIPEVLESLLGFPNP